MSGSIKCRRRTCPLCLRTVAINVKGISRKHLDKPKGVECLGSGWKLEMDL